MISILTAVAILTCLYYGLRYFLSVSYDPREPPLVRPRVPFFGHLIGILRDGSAYYGKIATEHGLAIYTLHLPRVRIYVVTSPGLISAIDRRSNSISFAPYVVGFARRVLVPSQHAIDTLEQNPAEENGDRGLLPETMSVMHQTLAPGEDLDRLSQIMLDGVTASLCLEGEASHLNGGRVVELFGWMRKTVIKASTDAVYGPENNPFQNPAVCDGFRLLEQDFVFLALGILPGIVAARGSRGRRIFFEAMHKYYAAAGHETASRLVQSRYEVNRKYGLSQSDIERFDLSVSIALLMNTVPSASWGLYHIYSRPLLLAELRDTLNILLSIPRPSIRGGARHHVQVPETITVNMPAIISAFPLLSSVVQEVLRMQSTNATGRVVLEDTLIDNTYLLKKDSVILVPSAEVHNNKSAWGPGAAVFDAARFLKQDEAQGTHRVPKSAYRAFGSGGSVCPGRHFAMNEILTILIVMMLQYDVVPVTGEWQALRTKSHVLTSILTPVEDIRVYIKERKDTVGLRWRFIWEAK